MAVIGVGLLFSSMALAGGGKALFSGEKEEGIFPRMRQILGTLALSPDQQSKTDAILQNAANSARTLRSQVKSGGDKTAIHEQLRSLRMQTIEQISQQLSPDQSAKFREELKSARQQIRQHRQASTQPSGN
jgi:uncharacterized membrane protein YccC